MDKFQFDPRLREETREKLGLKPDQLALLFAGSGWERKGLLFAIEALALCKDRQMRLLVAGRGNAALYKTRRLRFWRETPILFLGEIAELLPLYAAADIFILPTIYDPFSNACLEALAAGLPVITTRANGFSEIIAPGEEGEVAAEPHDITALSGALEKWSDASLREKVRPRLLTLASRFSIQANLEATLDV